MDETEVRKRLATIFSPGGRLHGRFQPPEDAALETTVPDAAWQAIIWPESSATPQLLRVYAVDNGNALLERYWRNEARALHRLAGRNVSTRLRQREREFYVATAAGDG